MARKYVNPSGSAPVATEYMVVAAQSQVDQARERLRAAEAADPSGLSWDSEYGAAVAAVSGAERRLQAVTALRSAQIERGGQRAGLVKAEAPKLAALAKGLTESRDLIAVIAAEHLRVLTDLKEAVDTHNLRLSSGREWLNLLGVATRDDLTDDDQGQEHAEGTFAGGGVRCGGTDWTPILSEALVVHGLLEAYGQYRGMFARLRGSFPAYQTTSRPDGLAVPELADLGAVLPAQPAQPVMPQRPSIGDVSGRRTA